MSASKDDILFRDAEGRPVLAIEANMNTGKTPEWAAKMRRNLVENGWVSRAPYFLLALPDCFYLWKNAPHNGEVIEPTYVSDPTPLLRPYYEGLESESPSYSEIGFQMVLFSLFGRPRQLKNVLLCSGQQTDGLVESGLLEALATAKGEFQAAA